MINKHRKYIHGLSPFDFKGDKFMILSLDEMKGYLRVDFNDDDALIESFIVTGENLCADIARLSVAELAMMPTSKIAVMYAVAYLYEHREDADHHQLSISLRSLLEGVRRSVF